MDTITAIFMVSELDHEVHRLQGGQCMLLLYKGKMLHLTITWYQVIMTFCELISPDMTALVTAHLLLTNYLSRGFDSIKV